MSTNNRPQSRNHLLPCSPAVVAYKIDDRPLFPCSPVLLSPPLCSRSTYVEISLQIALFLAKQSQSQNGQYERKYSMNKDLCQRTTNNDQQTLFKTKPIKPNSPTPLLRRERIQNLGAKRISRFIGPASKISNPASRIKHLPHFATEPWLHYAKQSQSQNGQYEHKYSKNKGLCQRTTKNQQRTSSKTNPIKPNSPAQNPFFRSETHVAQSLSQAKLCPQLSRNFASPSFSSLRCGHDLVSAAAASAQPDASLQAIWFDTIMPSKYHFCLIDVHR